MTGLTPQAATELFRSEPGSWIDVGAGEAAHRQVGSGPDVLFVHGWPVHGATFRHLLPVLAEHVTCHVVDLPGTGSSRFDESTPLSIDQHIESVRRLISEIGSNGVAVVGHDSGGLITRHAAAGHPGVRAIGLINTEPPPPMPWRFRSFLMTSRLPGFGSVLRWALGKPRVRRNKFVLGDAFADRSLIDGDFDDFFLRPLRESNEHLTAAIKLIDSFEARHVDELAELHPTIDVPVQMVWGDRDPFFPVARAREMVTTFPDATLTEVPGAGLFSHEEAPTEVAGALLDVLTR